MPYADNGGVRIYYRTEGEGPPGLTHLQGFVRADLVLPRVTTFLPGAAPA